MTDTPNPEPEVQAADLSALIEETIYSNAIGSTEGATDAVMNVLREGGWIKDGVPPVVQVLADAQQFSDELVLTKLVARFFRVMILGGVIIPETPAAMEWLKDYIDGNLTIHGPLGKPMLWPGRLPSIVQLLRDWGFQPTPTNPQFVSARPGGALAIAMHPDPEAPDRAGVPIIEDKRAQNMGALLDTFTSGLTVGAVDRGTAIRAMSAAFDKGATFPEGARDALEPFAKAAWQIQDDEEGDEWMKVRLTVGDYREARDAYVMMGGTLEGGSSQ